MKARNVSVSVVESDDQIKVWGASFTLKGNIPRYNGVITESNRRKIEKQIQKVLEQVEFDLV
jgi:hypothetical protein